MTHDSCEPPTGVAIRPRDRMLSVRPTSLCATLAPMRLRVDPWDPEYGASVELDAELEPAAGLDLTVEVAGAWTPIPATRRVAVPCCAFVDGVRRVDVRLFAEEGDVSAPGLAGSWAVG